MISVEEKSSYIMKTETTSQSNIPIVYSPCPISIFQQIYFRPTFSNSINFLEYQNTIRNKARAKLVKTSVVLFQEYNARNIQSFYEVINNGNLPARPRDSSS